jgi:hypothetical protein
MSNAQDWQETLHDLSRRRQQAHEMGGAERLAKHRAKRANSTRAPASTICSTRDLPGVRHLVGGEIAPTASSRAPDVSTGPR